MSGVCVESVDPREKECEDYSDWDAVRRGFDFTEKDIEQYQVVHNFIYTAYYNIVIAVSRILEKQLPNNRLVKRLSFEHGSWDSEDNHSNTLDQLWSLRISILDKDYVGGSRRIWFPCRLFWKKRKEITEWFAGDGGTSFIKYLVRWLEESLAEIEGINQNARNNAKE